jgi:hypothetical protein
MRGCGGGGDGQTRSKKDGEGGEGVGEAMSEELFPPLLGASLDNINDGGGGGGRDGGIF